VKKVQIVVLLVGAIALILVILALQLLAPGGKIDQTGEGNAHIVFSADQGMLIAPGSCVTVRWQVDHIQAVHFDDQPAVGQGIEQVCTNDGKLPVLQIEFRDDTVQNYQLRIRFLVERPLSWFLFSVGVLLTLSSLCVALSRPSSTPPTRPSRRMLIFAVLGMVTSTVIVLGVIAEVGLRLYFGQFGTKGEKIAYLRSRAEIIAAQSDLLTFPFVGYVPSPDFPGHNTLGYRGDEILVPKPSGVYRIVVLGDSSTYGALVPYDKTYPADLQQILRDDYGYKNLDVVNGGVPLHTSWNFLMNLAFRVSELQPNLVIVYPGWNDLSPREQSPDCYSAPGPFLGLGASRYVLARPADLSPSALSRFLSIGFGWMPIPTADYERVTNPDIQCPPQVKSEIPQNLQANPPIYFERNLREMIGIAHGLGIKIMFMTWAYNPHSPLFPEYRAPGIVEQNAIIARVAQENGALFFDYAPIASMDPMNWEDISHVSVRGALEQAQKIARFLVDQGVITQQQP
jgi:lysophospholipase L1-like esterase